MSARDELATIIESQPALLTMGNDQQDRARSVEIADAILAAGYTKPRTIKSPAELEALAFGSAVLTSDESDTVVLKAEGDVFRNQSGYEVNALTLWSYGTQPFTVLWEPTA